MVTYCTILNIKFFNVLRASPNLWVDPYSDIQDLNLLISWVENEYWHICCIKGWVPYFLNIKKKKKTKKLAV